jgi:hypothetical protein
MFRDIDCQDDNDYPLLSISQRSVPLIDRKSSSSAYTPPLDSKNQIFQQTKSVSL